jgi:hypothetical protein
MAQQQQQASRWRGRLGIWLRAVANDASMFRGNLQMALDQHRHDFPPSPFYSTVRRCARDEVAKWFLKQAIQDVSQAESLNLTPEAIDMIADLSVTLL